MGFFSKIGSAFKWLWRKLNIVNPDTGKPFDQELAEVALDVVEGVSGLDLNGDGKTAALREALAGARLWGLQEVQELIERLGEEIGANNLRRIVAIVRLAEAAAPMFKRVLGSGPKVHLLELAIAIALRIFKAR